MGYLHIDNKNDKEKVRNLRKYKKKRDINRDRGGKVVIGTLEARELREQGKKYCPKCKMIKALEEFNKFREKEVGYCIVCSRELGKKYHNKERKKEIYENNRDEARNDRLKRKFGITLKEYNKKLEKQKKECAVCGKTPEGNGKALAVDHNHETGEIRDLLCNNCNVLIGFLKEDLDLSLNLTKYIRRWVK